MTGTPGGIPAGQPVILFISRFCPEVQGFSGDSPRIAGYERMLTASESTSLAQKPQWVVFAEKASAKRWTIEPEGASTGAGFRTGFYGSLGFSPREARLRRSAYNCSMFLATVFSPALSPAA